MPMSIRFEEQEDGPYSLTAKRSGVVGRWQKWDPQHETWIDIKGWATDVMARAFPDANVIEGYRLQAARYTDRLLQQCDGYHALVIWRWVKQDPGPFRGALHIAVVRGEVPFKGSIKVPEWTHLPPSAWERIGGDGDSV
jgi:hypothetical protein